MKHLRKRLTFANVMSMVAVFIALGGAAFAATQLPKNSVGSKQLKKNAVTAAKIKKNAVTTSKIKKDAVTGAQVNESTLGTVPSASLANSLSPLEATHIVGAPGEPGFENGAHNIPVTGEIPLIPVGFYKDHEGIVHLQGVAEVGKNPSGVATVFTLPPGFRPAPGHAAIFEQLTEATAIVFGGSTNIAGFELSGKVLGNEERPIVLEGITYKAES
ncbi:MAG TPA: hypothetical protein VFX44_00905 [Solirubrobacterales bacterium]|nr:hypothetical protein [Solirubrobacterales bacterium]